MAAFKLKKLSQISTLNIELGCGYVSRFNYGSNFELVREGGVCGGKE
jgi:hypothetical protein